MIRSLTLATVASAAALTLSVSAQDDGDLAGGYDLSWNTVDGGGRMDSAGGTYELGGTIGQPDASPISMAGGTFELQGGFWPGIGSGPIGTCPGDVVPPPNGDGLINIDDLFGIIGAWGTADPQFDIAPPGGSGSVDIDDLFTVIGAWGSCP